MTNKEIIDGLKFTVDMFLFDASTGEVLAEPRNDMDKITVDACREAIKALKQQKTGKWIYESEDWNKWTCSECGWSKRTDVHVSLGYNYCPNCGADLSLQEE